MTLLKECVLATASKALFLDRDGVINVEKEYLYKIEEVAFVTGIFELCRHYQQQGYLIIIVTNQSGIARGMYTEEDFAQLSAWMQEAFAKEGITISAIYNCPHHPDFTGDCACRKPKPKMLLDAARQYGLDMAHSLLIGDSERDIEAAVAAGVGETVLLSSRVKSSKATRIVTELSCLY